jgi:hypothetical protein
MGPVHLASDIATTLDYNHHSERFVTKQVDRTSGLFGLAYSLSWQKAGLPPEAHQGEGWRRGSPTAVIPVSSKAPQKPLTFLRI